MSDKPNQAGDKNSDNKQPEDPTHPGMSADPAERGRQLGHENAQGGQSVGTGGHGGVSGGGGSQPVGGKHASDPSNFSQEQLHPGMNPDPAERGRQLGHENAQGGHSVGTGGHGNGSVAGSSQPVGGKNTIDESNFSQEQLHPGMNPDPAERGRQLGHENADGGHSTGTGGHGGVSAAGSNQPVGGKNATDQSNFSQEQLHPGMNPDPAERGRQLGHENAEGGQSTGTGGHAK